MKPNISDALNNIINTRKSGDKTPPKPDKAEELARMLSGGGGAGEIAAIKGRYRIQDCPYFVLSVTPVNKAAEVKSYLTELSNAADIIVSVDKNIAFLKCCREEDDYQQAAELGLMLADNIKDELGIETHIGIGGLAANLEGTSEAYAHSLDAVRIGRAIDGPGAVYNYKDYLIVKLFEKLPKEALEAFVAASVGKPAFEAFDDAELMDTAMRFLHDSLNISETARLLFMHRNTLIYRLDKIEKLTGLNIRRFSDAVTFRYLNIIYKLLKK